jgi:hypothetical protein
MRGGYAGSVIRGGLGDFGGYHIVVRLDVLEGRLHDLEEWHKGACGQHPADDADKKPELVLAGVFPDAPVRLPRAILAVEELLFVFHLCHVRYFTIFYVGRVHRTPCRPL